MLDLSKLHAGGLKAVRDSRDYYDETTTAERRAGIDHEILNMSLSEFLDAVLEWHGIRGYTSQIIDIYEAAKDAEIREVKVDFTGKESENRYDRIAKLLKCDRELVKKILTVAPYA